MNNPEFQMSGFPVEVTSDQYDAALEVLTSSFVADPLMGRLVGGGSSRSAPTKRSCWKPASLPDVCGRTPRWVRSRAGPLRRTTTVALSSPIGRASELDRGE